MSLLINSFDSLFLLVVRQSVKASILAVIILLFRFLFNKKLNVKLQYMLWFVILLRLVLPQMPKSNMSMYNYLPSYINEKPISIDAVGFENSTISKSEPATDVLVSVPYEKKTDSLHLISILWAASIIIGLLITSLSWLTFLWNLREKTIVQDKDVLFLLRKCTQKMNIDKTIPLILDNSLNSPALIGIISPKILIPKSIIDEHNLEALEYIFLHELSHLKRKDILINSMCNIVKLIYWFNPLLLYCFYKMREDQEICCDFLALSHTNDNDIVKYGLTIINLAEKFGKVSRLHGAAVVIKNKSQIKRRISMIKLFKKNSYRLSAIAIAILIGVGCLTLTDAKAAANKLGILSGNRIIDKIDYPFENDTQIVGQWESVDFVKDIASFKPGVKSWGDKLYLKGITFFNNGKVGMPYTEGMEQDLQVPVEEMSWTKGIVISKPEKTASHYTIKDIDGVQYMFIEWKNGDYRFNGTAPYYYVMKKITNSVSEKSLDNVPRKTDKTDYPFINDPEVIGKWESVDFVDSINQFKPGSTYWRDDLYLKSMTFLENGKLTQPECTGKVSADNNPVSFMVWTKGLIIHFGNKTASQYTIKEIDGAKYMFFEWKSGDYTIRGQDPYYYVLKKVN